jgi:hypothetical protein
MEENAEVGMMNAEYRSAECGDFCPPFIIHHSSFFF